MLHYARISYVLLAKPQWFRTSEVLWGTTGSFGHGLGLTTMAAGTASLSVCSPEHWLTDKCFYNLHPLPSLHTSVQGWWWLSRAAAEVRGQVMEGYSPSAPTVWAERMKPDIRVKLPTETNLLEGERWREEEAILLFSFTKLGWCVL